MKLALARAKIWIAIRCVEGMQPGAIVQLAGVGALRGGEAHGAIAGEMAQVRPLERAVPEVRCEQHHLPLRVAERAGGGIRQIRRIAGLRALVEDDELRAGDRQIETDGGGAAHDQESQPSARQRRRSIGKSRLTPARVLIRRPPVWAPALQTVGHAVLFRNAFKLLEAQGIGLLEGAEVRLVPCLLEGEAVHLLDVDGGMPSV